jgi:hypothetical protein
MPTGPSACVPVKPSLAVTPEPTARGFPDLPCLRCGETDTTTVNLGEGLPFACGSCDQETTTAEADEMLSAWRAVLDWCAKAPPGPGLSNAAGAGGGTDRRGGRALRREPIRGPGGPSPAPRR